MPRIILLDFLSTLVRKSLSAHRKPVPIYGRSYREENLVQLWSLEPRAGLQEVAKAVQHGEETHLLLGGDRIPWNHLEVVPYHADYTSRAEGIVDTDLLSTKLVTLVGLGSVGSVIAVYLAQSWVGRFRLLDMDTLLASNISRHACDINHLGRLKTRAVQDLIVSRNPQARVKTFEDDFLELAFETQLKRLEGSDLVIASTDSNACQFMVNELCLNLNVPSLYVGCYERAQAGEVAFVVPGKTPCLNCLLAFRSKSLHEMKRKERRIPYTDEDQSGLKAEPGLAIDIAYPTVVAAACALALLQGDSRREALLDPARNLILLHSGSKPEGYCAEIFKAPFDYVLGKSKRNEGCEVCQNAYSGEVNQNATRTNIG